ncbi:MAG TPA: hypothetical protein VFH78_10780 [Candidatus Thermoplasmatota archaeon]|nr:hypothetical protein [Candidatus Thermoplasmatota archaeon]
MGRTEPTFRLLLERIEAEWRDYRRGLSPREQEAFDALFQKARAHASASSNVGRVDPLESVLLSMLLEHEMELRDLRMRLVRLERVAVAAAGGAPSHGQS